MNARSTTPIDSHRGKNGQIDRIMSLLNEIGTLLATGSYAECRTFWSEFESIKAKYRQTPELPDFLARRRNMSRPRASDSELPDFLARRKAKHRR